MYEIDMLSNPVPTPPRSPGQRLVWGSLRREMGRTPHSMQTSLPPPTPALAGGHENGRAGGFWEPHPPGLDNQGGGDPTVP